MLKQDAFIVRNRSTYFFKACFLLVSLIWVKIIIANPDSLLRKLHTYPKDSSRVQLLFEIAQHYEDHNEDSLFLQYIEQTLEAAENIGYIHGMIWALDEKGYYLRKKADYTEALNAHFHALRLAEELKYKQYLPRINNNIGVVYRRLDDYSSAVNYHLKALKYGEQYKDFRSTMYARNSLGNVFALMKQYDQAMEYFNQALEQAKQRNNLRSLAINYNNIGELLETKGELEEALRYYFKSLEFNEQIESKRGIAISYDCIGSVYVKTKKFEKAIDYFKKAMEIDQTLGDDFYVAVSSLNIGKAYMKLNRFEEALHYLKRALKLSRDIGAKSTSRDAHKYLSTLYENSGMALMALRHYKDFTTYKDSILNEKNSQNISKLQTLYETEKQRKEIALLEQEKSQREKSNRRKTIFLLVLAIAFVLLAILAFALFRANLIKRKNNKVLEKQAIVIRDKNNELQLQKRKLEQTNNKITDSLLYAQKIQQALLPRKSLLQNLFDDYFILYHPLSVVSGDFYWAGEFEDKVIFTVADCTGHGVPGAMMSMLGNSYLNETIRNPKVRHASQILNEMRSMIISSLHQQGLPGESKDGLEMSLCIYDKKSHILEFAGAHISIYIAKYNPSASKNYELIELKGNKMPVGYYRKMSSFTDQTYKIEPEDIIYMFTDGYVDQFGGKKGQKFQSKAFRNVLIGNAHKPLHEQQELIEKTFLTWKNDYEQIDDVLVMGVKPISKITE